MSKAKGETAKPKKREPKALTLEARENQLIALAYDRVEQRILDGTATSQELTHFLRLGSSREKLEQEFTKEKIELSKAKKEMCESAKHIEELYTKAIDAMKLYGGYGGTEDGTEEDVF